MTKSDDIFEARLRRLQDTNAKTPAKTAQRHSEPAMRLEIKREEKDRSVLLPIAAVALLLCGGAAFATMLFIPDPAAGQLAASDAPLAATILD